MLSSLYSNNTLTTMATQAQMQQQDQLQAGSIDAEMQSNAQLFQMQNWQMAQETQSQAYSMLQDTTSQRAKNQDKVYEKWISVIRD